MSDSAPSAAPAAAPTTNGAPTTASVAVAAPPVTNEPQEWTPDAEKQLLGLLKRSPFGKFKANGVEEILDSPDKLKAALLDASRGRGAAKIAAEAKKEIAEAKEAKAKAELLERALNGDADAMAKLGRRPQAEVDEHQRQLESLPPEVRQLLEAHNAAQEENQKLREQIESRAKAEEQRRIEVHAAQIREQALGFAQEMIEKLGTDTTPEEILPSILEAWNELTAAGLKMGEDITPEQVLFRANQLWERETSARFKKLGAKSFMGAAIERIQTMPIEDVISALPEGYRRKLARALAVQAKTAADKASVQPAPKQEERRAAPVPQSRILSPFRWK